MKANKSIGILKVKAKLENGGFVCLVNVSNLFFDTYQRLAIPLHVKRIAANWDEQSANLLKISLREDRLWCFDGRQTSAAVGQVPGRAKELDAIIFTGLTKEREARLFFVQNDVPRKMAGWTKFFADMAAGNDTLREIVGIVHNNKLNLPGDPGVHKTANADITSPRALLEAFNEGGFQFVDRICKVLNKSWREGCGTDCNIYSDAKKLDMLRGLIHFLRDPDFSSLPDKTLLTVLKAHPPADVRALANHQPSKGRIDASQITSALRSIFGTGPGPMRRAA